jgi:adenine-specific DNA-methyltransferase
MFTLEIPGVMPMIYQSNMRSGGIDWPQTNARKPQCFVAVDDAAIRQLLPQGPYVVVKRQTAKEDRRRVIAALWDGPSRVAFDNKTNYERYSKPQVIEKKKSALAASNASM